MISNLIKNFNRKEEKEVNSVVPYLEFKSSTPMTITPNYTNTGITLQYSLDTITWNNITAKAVTPSASVIYFRGSATGTKSLFTIVNISNAWIFTGATNLEVNGEITMLLQDTLGGMVSDVPSHMYCYSSMFFGCTSLIKAPNLPATTLTHSCYSNMFYGCTGLTTVPALPATTLADYCYSSMFRGCTSLTTVPALPATTLAVGCYSSMFYGCTSLTTVPALPATTLAASCYNGMFRGCTKIKLSTTKTGSYQTAYSVPTVGTGVTASGDLNNMFTGTGGTFANTPTINTTYYTENTIV